MKAVELPRCARIAMEACGNVTAGERVLIVTDTMPDHSVARALMGAALAADAAPVLTVMPARRSAPQEPPEAVRAAMQAADIAFLVHDLFAHSFLGAGRRAEGRSTDHLDAGCYRRRISPHVVGGHGPSGQPDQ